MRIYKVIIGEDGTYYDRRDCLHEEDCEVRFLVASSYENADRIVRKYMEKNYEDAEYELAEWEAGEGLLENELLVIEEEYVF